MLWTKRIDGRPPVLVFLHEALGSVAQWREFPDRLCSATGRAGFLYDRTGHGQSPAKPGPQPRDYLYREAGLLESLIGPDSILIGHSDGASIALIYAARRSVRGVIAIAPHIDVERAAVEGIRQATGQFPEWQSKLERYHGNKTAMLLQDWADTWLNPEFAASFSIRELLPQITCPVLAIQCDDDPYATDRQLAGIKELVPAAQIGWLSGCGHVPHWKREAEVLDLAVGFVDGIG